jgi:hypothetical protein
MRRDECAHLDFGHVACDPDDKCALGNVFRIEIFDLLDPDAGEAVGVSAQGAAIRVLAEKRFAKAHRAQRLVVVAPCNERGLGPPFELRKVARAKRRLPHHIGQERE